MISPYLASSLVVLFTPENTSQFKLVKDQNSFEIYDFFLNTNLPVTLYSSMLAFRDTNKSFKLDGDLLQNVD